MAYADCGQWVWCGKWSQSKADHYSSTDCGAYKQKITTESCLNCLWNKLMQFEECIWITYVSINYEEVKRKRVHIYIYLASMIYLSKGCILLTGIDNNVLMTTWLSRQSTMCMSAIEIMAFINRSSTLISGKFGYMVNDKDWPVHQ